MALDTNLVSYYKLDESSGNAADSVGANTLTNNGTVGYAAALINNGADFGTTVNVGQYLGVASNLGIGATTAYTISMWVKLRTEISSGAYYFISLQKGTSQGFNNFGYDYNAGTRRLFYDTGGGGGTYNLTMGTSSWYHLVITAAGGTSTTTLYVNATSVSSDADAISGGGTGEFDVGGNVGSSCAAYIDEVGVWTRELTGTEVTELYNSGAGLAYPFPTTNIKTLNTITSANTKSVNTIVRASVKSVNTIT